MCCIGVLQYIQICCSGVLQCKNLDNGEIVINGDLTNGAIQVHFDQILARRTQHGHPIALRVDVARYQRPPKLPLPRCTYLCVCL